MPIVIETYSEFKHRMNCEYLEIGEGFSWKVLFANGGVWSANLPLDPPTDPKELLRRKRDFIKARLDRENAQFNSAYNDAMRIGNLSLACENVDGLSPAVLESLEQGKQRIAKLREDLAAIDKDLIDPEEVAREQHRQQVIRDVHRRREEAFKQLLCI
jgi:hypothetical protein